MLHCDEETLSLLALGESGPADAEAHVAQCPRCSAELAALSQLVHTARGPEIDLAAVPRIAPPPRVWEQIAAATGVRSNPHPDEVIRHTTVDVQADRPTPEPAQEPVSKPTSEPAPRPEPGERSGPVFPRQRTGSWTPWLNGRVLAIAASCLTIGLLGGVLGTRLLTDDGASAGIPPVVAATRLDGLPAAPSASGQADVVQSATGRTLDVNARQLGVPNGFYQVWLINRSVTKMVPIGVLSGAEGRFSLPAGMNLADYPLVDVSLEPLDGNPAHSGTSVLRGTLSS